MTDTTMPDTGFTRRTLAKGVAWSVPAVAVAAAAPAFAASGIGPDVSFGVACKLPGASAQGCGEVFAGFPGLDPDKAYAIPLLITNNSDKNIVLKSKITITSSGLPFDVVGISPGYCSTIATGATAKVIVYANSANSANQSVTLGLTIPWGHDCEDSDHVDEPVVIPGVVIANFAPCSSRVPYPSGAPTCDPPFYKA